MVMVGSSESVHELYMTKKKAPGYVTIIYNTGILKASACDIPKLNYALESHCLFTDNCMISKAQNGSQSCR